MKTAFPRIEPLLLRLLRSQQEAFTKSQLLAKYTMLQGEHGRDKRAAGQFIERNLQRLLKAGAVVVISDPEERYPRYKFGDLETSASPVVATNLYAINVLREKLQRHRVEFLSTIGEVEAYDEVCIDLPQLQSSIQRQYDEARDRSSKLVGRIQALESLIETESGRP